MSLCRAHFLRAVPELGLRVQALQSLFRLEGIEGDVAARTGLICEKGRWAAAVALVVGQVLCPVML